MPFETIYVVAAIIRNDADEFLITQRLPGARYGGLWEFPGGTMEDGESPKEALIRELKEELNIEVEVNDLFWHESFKSTTKIIDIQFINCILIPKNQTIKKIEVADYRWVRAEELNQYKFPEADKAFIRHLTSRQTIV